MVVFEIAAIGMKEFQLIVALSKITTYAEKHT